jgi:hypothetical protein
MRKALCYSVLLTLSTYALSIIFIGKHVLLTLGGRLVAVLITLLVSYVVSVVFRPKLPALKLKRRDTYYAVALMFPLYALSIVGMLF